MKLSLLFSILILVSFIARADVNDEKEKAFELESENIQIHDFDGERKSAQKEAIHQEKIEKERKQRLDQLRSEKDRVLKKSKADVANFEFRRKKAEKNKLAYDNEINSIQKQIKTLEQQVALKETQAKTAEDLASTGKKELEKEKDKRAELQKRREKASNESTKYNDEAQKLRGEYQHVASETKQLEEHVTLLEENAKQKLAQKNAAQRDLASIKSKNKAFRDKIRSDTGSP